MARQPIRQEPARVRRLAVLWGDTLLDLVSVEPGRPTVQRLRSGARITAHLPKGAGPADPVLLRIDDDEPRALLPGAVQQMPSGHRVLAVVDRQAPAAEGELFLDGRLFHAFMVSAAVQVCLVSALVLTPKELGGSEPGGGVKVGDVARFLHVTGGLAQQRGAPSFAAPGRRPDEAERIERLVPVRGAPTAVAHGGRRGPTLQEALDAMLRVVNRGSDGVELREALGDLARATARAPDVGAGFGGLVPRDMFEPGAGSGVIGLGRSQSDVLVDDMKRRLDETLQMPEKPKYEITVPASSKSDGVARQDGLDGDVDIDMVELPAEIRDHLSGEVVERANAVRACYESWGLARDASTSGRLVLELTLRPDGTVGDAATTVSDPRLTLVGDCTRRVVKDWYLGAGLVQAPLRLAFPFVLKPHRKAEPPVDVVDFTK